MGLDVDDLEVEQKSFKERDKTEFKIHTAIVKHIKEDRAFTAFVTHIWQGRSAKDGFFLKMLGVVPGVADLLIIWRSKCDCGISKVGIGFLEVKKLTGTASTPQRKFMSICKWLGVPYAIVRSVTEAHEALKKWGCPENHQTIKEPDIRTFEQKKKDAYDYFKP